MKSFKSLLIEASYAGNLGLMELLKFHQLATKEQSDKVKELIAKNRHIDAWAIVQNVSGTRLQGKQFNESTESSTDTTVSIAVTSLHSVQQSHRLF
jgi:hypothetical protein